MLKISKVSGPQEKSAITEKILRALPEWFGIEKAIVDYGENCKSTRFFIAAKTKKAVGFISLKTHNPYTAEIYVMGVIKELHRKGIGRALIEHCEKYCKDTGIKFLTVKTLACVNDNAHYAKTTAFYMSIGFRPLEIFPLFWDAENPCLFMAKYLS